MIRNKSLNIFKFFLFVTFVLLSIFFVRMFDLNVFFSVEYLRDLVFMYGTLGVAFFILLYVIATIFFLPGTPLSVAAGVLFGTFLGTLYVVIGASIGAIIAFLIARYLGSDFISDVIENRYSKIYEYDVKLGDHGFWVVLFFRLVPLFPFNALNFLLGLTRVRFRDYVIGTIIGIIPGSFVLAYFGDSLAMLDLYNIIFAVVLFLLLSLVPLWYKKYKKV